MSHFTVTVALPGGITWAALAELVTEVRTRLANQGRLS